MKTLAPALLSFFLATFLASPAQAELYQWKDENGRVHFSDTKPGGSSANVSTVQQPEAQRPSGRKNADSSNTGNHSSSQERQQRLLQVMKQEAEQKEAERKQQQLAKQQREAECLKLRTHQNDIAGHPVFRTDKKDENGNTIWLDEKQREEYDQDIAARISKACE